MGSSEANGYHNTPFRGYCCGPSKELLELSVENHGKINLDKTICGIYDIIAIC